MNPIIYARISPSRDNKNNPDPESIDQQIERCKKYLEMLDIDPESAIVIADKRLSARTVPLSERPGGAKVVKLLKGRKSRVVVATKLDRLFRDTVDGLTTLKTWHSRGIQLHLAAEGGVSFNTATANGKLCATLLLATNAHEAERTAERTSDAMKHHQKVGKRMSSCAPYGYTFDPEDNTRLLPDVAEQVAVRAIDEWFEEGCTPYRIAEKLNAEPHRFIPRGKRFHIKTIDKIIKREVD